MALRWRVYCITEGINKYVSAAVAPTVCPTNAGHTVNASSITDIDSYPTGGMYFGDANDGDATVSVNTSLARDMYYRNLTIDVSAVLNPNGYRIFVSDTLTVTGSISVAGGSGSGATGGSVPYTTKVLGTGAVGGAGGAAVSVGVSGGSLGSTTRMGGLGGAGGAGSAAGGVGGSATAVSDTQGGSTIFLNAYAVLRGRDITSIVMTGGTGGGGGGGASAQTGGGGGAGGGLIIIAARTIVQTGTITAVGGNGAAGGTLSGGGGGGGGGCIAVITSTVEGLTLNVNGGAGGTATGGVTGTSGAAGQSFLILI